MKEWVKDKFYEQIVSHENVQPRFDFKDNVFYLNSCAGLIKFEPKNSRELITFRDKWVNKFESILSLHRQGIESSNRFFMLYLDILNSDYKIKYKANARTRLMLFKHKIRKLV